MSYALPALFYATTFFVALFDPRRLPRRSALGRALKVSGRRGGREVHSALREGRAVKDPQLAELAAAVARDRMQRIDYRGPLLIQEKLMVLGLLAEGALVLVAGPRRVDATLTAVGASVIVVVWVVGLRRLTPTHRDRHDRLLTAYHENARLAAQSGTRELEALELGLI